MSDPINPSHYKHLPVEAIDIIMAAIAKAPSNESAYLQGQVLKYLLRCWSKKGTEDLRKAKWYLDRLVVSFDEVLAEAIETPPKRYREPTLEDLANGPVCCEVRDCNSQDWSKAKLIYIEDSTSLRFGGKTEIGIQLRWEQCRIEVAE